MTEVEWTNEQVIRLVTEYRNRPELWDIHHNLYRVQTAKYEAYSSMAECFECDISDLKKKLNSIFASHRREKGKVKLGGRSYWFLYPYLDFLPNHVANNLDGTEKKPRKLTQRKRPVSDEEDEEDAETEHSFDDNDGTVAEEIVIKEEPIPYQPPSKSKYSSSKPRLTRVLRRKLIKGARHENTTTNSRLLDTMKLIKKSDMLRKKDECDSFGEYIAVSLRKHDDRTQSMIKQAINNILFEQEMKRYNTAQYTVVLADMEENPLMDEEK